MAAIRAGQDSLIAAPTGSDKTLAAFLTGHAHDDADRPCHIIDTIHYSEQKDEKFKEIWK